MKPSQLKRWDVFENTTGNLCMVIHKGDSLKILSMSGSIYSVWPGGNYNYGETTMTAAEFVDRFPVDRLKDENNKRIFNIIKTKVKQNETIGITTTNGDGKSNSGITVPTGKRQVATGSRPTGNAVSFRVKKTRIAPTEVRPRIITC